MDPFALNLIMILCFIVGSGLIILEAFIPGFGVAGIFGIILEVVALWDGTTSITVVTILEALLYITTSSCNIFSSNGIVSVIIGIVTCAHFFGQSAISIGLEVVIFYLSSSP